MTRRKEGLKEDLKFCAKIISCPEIHNQALYNSPLATLYVPSLYKEDQVNVAVLRVLTVFCEIQNKDS